jgi:hypothetical protein
VLPAATIRAALDADINERLLRARWKQRLDEIEAQRRLI